MQMRPRNKLVAQIIVALISMLYGFIIPGITNPFNHNPATNWIELPLWAGIPLTLLWYVGMMNAINFLDGLDGLLSGVTAISGVFIFAISLLHANPVVALVVDRAGRRGARLSSVQLQSGAHYLGRCGVALHRLRVCDRLHHRRKQDRHCDQRRRAAASCWRCRCSTRRP